MTATINCSTSAGVVVTSDTSGSLALQTNSGVTALTIDTSQNVTCVGNITLNNGAADGAQLTLASSGYSNWNIDNYSGNLRAYYNATEYMRIDSSGNLLINQTSTILTGTVQFTYDGSSRQGMCIKNSANSSNGAAIRFIDYTNAYTGGGIYFTSSNSITYATSSDYRLKTNIVSMSGALEKVKQLKPVTFNWKQDGSASQGFIAHELQDIIPEAVIGTKDAVYADGKPMYQGIDTSYIVATLVSAIQEQQALIQTLQTQIAQLQAKVGV